MCELGVTDVINLTIFILLSLTIVPVSNRAVVACDTAVYFCLGSAVRTYSLLA